MAYSHLATAWLSNDMAQALAAACPPLATTDIFQAAQKLASQGRPSEVIDGFLHLGADLLVGRQVLEALRALRDIGTTVPELDSLVCGDGTGATATRVRAQFDPVGAEGVLQDAISVLSRVISPNATHNIVLAAMRRAEVEYPFLSAARLALAREATSLCLREHIRGVEAFEVSRAAAVVLANVVDLLKRLVGEDVATRLLHQANT